MPLPVVRKSENRGDPRIYDRSESLRPLWALNTLYRSVHHRGTYHRNHCEECEWSAGTDTHSRIDRSRLTIEHAVEHGHDINSEVLADLDNPS
jgi:hypothetical protein